MAEQLEQFYYILYHVLFICFPIGVIFLMKGTIKDNLAYVFIGLALWVTFFYAVSHVIDSHYCIWLLLLAYFLGGAYIDRKLPELRKAHLKLLEMNNGS